MWDKDRRGAQVPDYREWDAALDAVDRPADVQAAARPPIDNAELERQIAEIMTAAVALSDRNEPSDAVSDAARGRKPLLTWVLLGGIWIAMTFVALASIGAIVRFLT